MLNPQYQVPQLLPIPVHLVADLLATTLPQTRLRRRQPGQRHPVGQAANVVQADPVAEVDAGGVSAEFASGSGGTVSRRLYNPGKQKPIIAHICDW